MDRLISIHQVTILTTLSPSTIYRLIRKKKFPRGRLISSRRRAWLKREVDEWINHSEIKNEDN